VRRGRERHAARRTHGDAEQRRRGRGRFGGTEGASTGGCQLPGRQLARPAPGRCQVCQPARLASQVCQARRPLCQAPAAWQKKLASQPGLPSPHAFPASQPDSQPARARLYQAAPSQPASQPAVASLAVVPARPARPHLRVPGQPGQPSFSPARLVSCQPSPASQASCPFLPGPCRASQASASAASEGRTPGHPARGRLAGKVGLATGAEPP
jgi:hypothetical protein